MHAKMEGRRSSKRGAGSGGVMDIWKFAEALEESEEPFVTNIPALEGLPLNKWREYVGRLVLLETVTDSTTFARKSHMLAIVQGKKTRKNKCLWFVQPHNQNGDPDGKPQTEAAGDLWLLPKAGTVLRLTTEKLTQLVRYNIASNTVHLKYVKNSPENAAAAPSATTNEQPAATTAREAGAAATPGAAAASATTNKQPADTTTATTSGAKAVVAATHGDVAAGGRHFGVL